MSFLVGHTTFFSSVFTSFKNCATFSNIDSRHEKPPYIVTVVEKWQARRDSNPHHPDLESGALTVGATGLI